MASPREKLLFLGLVVWCLAWAAHAASPITSGDCAYPHFPTTFDSVSYLGLNGEFHVQNTYYINYRTSPQTVNFTLQQPTTLRVYLAPHVVDIDMVLRQGTNWLAVCSFFFYCHIAYA